MPLLLSLDGLRELLERWAPAAAWGVAIGTVLLAFATFILARRSRQETQAVVRESEAVADQVVLQRQQMRADQTPVVYPVFDVTWWSKYPETHIVLTNGGKGIGRHVTGRITYDSGIPWEDEPVWPQVEIVPTILSAGETQSVRLANNVNDWRQAYGFIDYRDMEGVPYRCDWEFDAIGEKPYFEVLAIDERAKMGDPPERR